MAKSLKKKVLVKVAKKAVKKADVKKKESSQSFEIC